MQRLQPSQRVRMIGNDAIRVTTSPDKSGAWALAQVAALGYSVADPTAFSYWANIASHTTNSTTLMVFTNPSSTTLFEILLRAQTTGDKVAVWWDDGLSNTYTLNDMAGADVTVDHTYGAGANRTIVLIGADRVRRLQATNAAKVFFGGSVTTWTWLTSLTVTGSNTLTGSVAGLTSLTTLTVLGSNTLSGSVAGLTGLTYLYVLGSNTLSGSVAGLTSLTTLLVTGSNTLSGSVAGLTSLTYLYVTGSNTLSGSVAGLTSLTYLYVTGSNTLSGSVAGLTSLTYLNVLGSNTLSGSVAGLTSLTYLTVTGTNTLSDLALLAANATKLVYFDTTALLDAATVNGVLAGFWLNRAVAKTRTERTIDLATNAGSDAPTGQGITDKAALQAYISPPGAVYWTVLTN